MTWALQATIAAMVCAALLAAVFQAWLAPAVWLALLDGLFLCG